LAELKVVVKAESKVVMKVVELVDLLVEEWENLWVGK
jgi:hypothetical protein